MKFLFYAATAPLWLPALFLAGSASIAIGMVCVVMSHALKDRNVRDNWDLAD